MFSRFFIYRPIFATVVSIVTLIAGFVAIKFLPVEEYPQVVPPQVSISAYYPGANAETIAKTVATQLEQQINGVDDMIYMVSTTSSNGSLRLNVFFEIGTDPDQATINVNNRVQAALSSLPNEVQARGVTVRKQSSTILKVISIYAEEEAYDKVFMANYALINIIDELRRVQGVGDASLFGVHDYSMRVWLEPDKLAKYSLATSDVIAALEEQNQQFAAGRINQSPNRHKESFTYTVSTQGRFATPSEFEDIIIRINEDGSSLRIKDVARVELGAESYDATATLNGQNMIPIGIYLQSGANALDTAKRVDEAMERLSKDFPDQMKQMTPYDTTTFIQISVNEVITTFIEALLLVVGVVYLFLGNFRATIIPVLAIPVSIIGTFAGMYTLGFSINLLTLFGLVLSIGIVVDDAIIVIENIERILRSNPKISVKDASVEAMKEITGPVVAIVLVLSAVFIPVAFMGGFTGQMYQQFAITIVISVTISGIVALTLTPALCAVFLKKETPKPFWFIRIFNKFFDFSTNVYSKGVGLVVKHGIISFLIVIGVTYATYDLFKKVPTGLVPMEDKGSLMVITSLPPAAALERTEVVRDTMTKMALSVDKVERATAIAGFDIVTGTPKTSSGFSFINLEDWSERKNKNESTFAISNKLNAMFSQIPEATLFALNPPPIMGLSISGGFEMYVQDHTGGTLHELGAHVGKILEKANQRPELVRVRSSFDISTPQYHIEVDREKAKAQNVPITSIYSTLQSTFGAHYVNDFNLFGRTYKVNVQSEAKSRENPEDLRNIYVKSTTGDMIPLNTLIEYERVTGADTVDRFNGFQAAKIEGEPAPGYTSGDALKAIEEVANEVLPHGFTLGWVGSSYQEKEMEGTGAQAFVFGGIFIFLILAAQYERWLMPLAVITSVPFALLGAILAVYLRGLSNDIYFQIGLLVLMGLSAKNAILIVEFAMQAQERGRGIFEATIEAARLRFRPIVMTSLAFTIGVIPLVLSTGAGAASRHAIGTGVFGGMVAASTIAIFFVPLFYSWLAKLNTFFNRKKGDEHESA